MSARLDALTRGSPQEIIEALEAGPLIDPDSDALRLALINALRVMCSLQGQLDRLRAEVIGE